MPTIQPATPIDGRLTDEGNFYRMILLPGDGKRLEFAYAYNSEKLPVGQPFEWGIKTGVVEQTMPVGHEWIAWQWHAPDSDPAVAGTSPFLALIIKDGVGRISVLREFSTPYQAAKVSRIDIVTGITFKLGAMDEWKVAAKIGEDGFVNVRRNGLLLADYQGPIGYQMAGLPYAKAGIYKLGLVAPYTMWAGRIEALVGK